ncbi:hypothetical protein CCACVL1_04104 [Corchorus capsularis]|uniref:Uncharacterized protein n=1 Tax=Corchorus capsularis TaxID=210143 RepID=A0A1R3JV70_COCAP|nr:hypothetical protein CCACVL1_04104 [Corchorus capsularis]
MAKRLRLKGHSVMLCSCISNRPVGPVRPSTGDLDGSNPGSAHISRHSPKP